MHQFAHHLGSPNRERLTSLKMSKFHLQYAQRKKLRSKLALLDLFLLQNTIAPFWCCFHFTTLHFLFQFSWHFYEENLHANFRSLIQTLVMMAGYLDLDLSHCCILADIFVLDGIIFQKLTWNYRFFCSLCGLLQSELSFHYQCSSLIRWTGYWGMVIW